MVGAVSAAGGTNTIGGPVDVYYKTSADGEYQIATVSYEDSKWTIISPALNLDESEYIYLKLSKNKSFLGDDGDVTSVTVNWQHESVDTNTIHYEFPNAALDTELKLPISTLGHRGDHDDGLVSWKTSMEYPNSEYPNSFSTHYIGTFLPNPDVVPNPLKADSFVGYYTSSSVGAPVLQVAKTEAEGYITAIQDEVSTSGAPVTSDFGRDVYYTVTNDGVVSNPIGTIKFGYSVNAYGTGDLSTARQLIFHEEYKYRKNANEITSNFTGKIPKDATYTKYTGVVEVFDYSQLKTLLEKGVNVKLGANIGDVKLEKYDNSITIPSGKTVTLDLNGHTVTAMTDMGSGSYSSANNTALIQNQGTLTITDSSPGKTGVLNVSAKNNATFSSSSAVISNLGTLTINSGTLKHTGGTSLAYAVDSLSTSTSPHLIVTGGNLVSEDYVAARAFANSATYWSNITVTGGTLTGAKRAISIHEGAKDTSQSSLKITG